ncbi:MAG: Calx-beta domain-containing protein, partial [Candidatus Eutrophobiaceae bacterium]
TLMLAKPSGVLSYNIDPDNLSAVGALVDAQSVPALSLTAASAAAEGDNIELTVTSDIAIAATAPDIGFTLTFAPRSSSGITGADFGGNYADLTQALTGVAFTGGSRTTATVPVATVNDTLYEGDEDYTATLSVPTGATLGSDFSEDGTLADNNDAPALSLEDASNAAEGSPVSLTIKSSSAFAARTVWNVVIAFSGTGIEAADFGDNVLSRTVSVTFAEGEDTATVPMATQNDTVYEGDEVYTATLSAASAALYTVTSSSSATASGTITDNDTPALSLTAAGTATEGDDIQLTVTSDIAIAATAPDIGFTLTFAARSGSGITGADFTNGLMHALTEVKFTGGSDTIATVPIATVDDTAYEGNEDYTATLSAASAALYTVTSSSATASGTITDNDTPALSLTAAGTATEGDDIQLTVTSNIAIAATAPDIGFTLTFAARSGSGITGADFGGNYADLTQALTGVTFTGGSRMIATVLVATVNDTLYEGDEDYTATLSVPTGATLDTDDSEDGTLADNDTPALSLQSASDAAEGSPVSLTIKSSRAFAAQTVWDVIIAFSGTGIDAADFDDNVLSRTVSVTFAAGEDTATVPVATQNDTVYEGDEDYTATLSAALYTVTSSNATASGTITDNDTPALSLTAASTATEGNDIQLTVTSDIAIAATAPDIGFTLTFAARSGSGITG